MFGITSSYILTFCRIVIELIFLVSFTGKVLNIHTFKQTIINFAILPKHLSNIATLLFLSGEFAVVVLMAAGNLFIRIGFVLAFFLLFVFCLALISVLLRKIQISCNCFGSKKKLVTLFEVWRNIGFMLCAVGGYEIIAWSGVSQRQLSLTEWGLTGLSAAVFVMIWTQYEEIVQLFR